MLMAHLSRVMGPIVSAVITLHALVVLMALRRVYCINLQSCSVGEMRDIIMANMHAMHTGFGCCVVVRMSFLFSLMVVVANGGCGVRA